MNVARTAFNSATDTYNRQLVLREKGVVPQSAVDDAKTARDSAAAQLEAAERQLEVARLPARPDEIAAAERNVAAEEANLSQAKIALDRRTIEAPATGMIEETFFEPGREVLVARGGDEVAQHVAALAAARARAIGQAAYQRVMAEHTYAHRAAQFDAVLEGCRTTPVEAACA